MQRVVQRVIIGTAAVFAILGVVLLDVMIAQQYIMWEPLPPGTPAAQASAIHQFVASTIDTPVGRLLARGSTLPIAIFIAMLAGLFEMKRLLQSLSLRPHIRFAVLMIALLIFSPWLSAAGILGYGPQQLEGLYWQMVWLAAAGVGAAALSVCRKKPEGTLGDLGATWLIILYLGFLPSFAVQLRASTDIPEWHGAWLMVISLLVIKATDMGAYLAGTLFGRTSLALAISPSKTLEGAVGGLAGSVAMALFFAYVGQPMQAAEPVRNVQFVLHEIGSVFARNDTAFMPNPYLRAVVFGLALSVVAQFGDLLESAFKREAGIKDSGKIIPAFGGILDLVDSPVLAMPLAWFLLIGVWSLG